MLDNIKDLNWENNPNVLRQIADEIEETFWERCNLKAVRGWGENRALRFYNVKKEGPFTPRIKQNLQGDGVRGNADFDSNVDKMEIFATTMYPVVIGNSLNSDIEFYNAMNNINFVKEAASSLRNWMVDYTNRAICAALACDVTNVVVADSTKGAKDSTGKASVSAACAEVRAGDIVSVETLRRAITLAKTGKAYNGSQLSAVKPCRITHKNIAGAETDLYSYLIVLDSYQCEQLKKDPQWIEAQGNLTMNRGLDSGFFTGLIGQIDGCPVIELPVWGFDTVGLANSKVSDSEFKAALNLQNHKDPVCPSAYAGSQPTSMGFLLGANALLAVGTPQTRVLFEKRDYGRKTGAAVDKVLTIAKGRYDMSQSETWKHLHNKDIGIVGICSSHE